MYRTQQNHEAIKSPTDEHVEHDENYEFSGATLKISSVAEDPLEVRTNLPSSGAILTGTDTLFSSMSDQSTPTSNQHEDKVETTTTYPQVVTSPTMEPTAPIVKPKVGTPANFFSFRPGLFDQAVTDVTNILLKSNSDTDVVGSWLLTEVNHWDHERERVFVLTTKSLWEIKYDFIALRILAHTKVDLSKVDTIIKGQLQYPENSLVPKRSDTGIRLMWNNGQPVTFLQSWNPFSNQIPWKTITDHPLFSYKDPYNSPEYIKENLEKNRNIYSADLLYQSLVRLFTERSLTSSFVNRNFKFEEGPIMLQNYVGIGAIIHNQHNFGFFKVRGKFSF